VKDREFTIEKIEMERPQYHLKITLDDGSVYHKSPIDDFRVGDRVRKTSDRFGDGMDDGIPFIVDTIVKPLDIEKRFEELHRELDNAWLRLPNTTNGNRHKQVLTDVMADVAAAKVKYLKAKAELPQVKRD
jgi:hypothetical protein